MLVMGDTYTVLGGVSTRLFIKILVVLRIWYVPHRTIHRPTDRKYIMSQQNFDPNQSNYSYNPNMQQGMGQQPYEQEAPDARSKALLSYLSPILLGLFGPLIFWAIYKDKPGYGFTKRAATRGFNMMFTWCIVATILIVLALILFSIGAAGAAASHGGGGAGVAGIMALLSMLVITAVCIGGLIMLIFNIMGAVKSNNGEDYNYPVPYFKLIKE